MPTSIQMLRRGQHVPGQDTVLIALCYPGSFADDGNIFWIPARTDPFDPEDCMRRFDAARDKTLSATTEGVSASHAKRVNAGKRDSGSIAANLMRLRRGLSMGGQVRALGLTLLDLSFRFMFHRLRNRITLAISGGTGQVINVW